MKPARLLTTIAGLLLVGPLLVIPVQAVANVWRSPALWPQELGSRGFSIVANDAVLPEAVANSALIAAIATVIGLLVGWPAARALAGPPFCRRLTLLVFTPLLLPPLVVGEGLQVWYLRLGLADHVIGIALAHLVFVVPYIVLVLLPAFTDDVIEQEQAAVSLGASSWSTWVLVTFPATRGALLLSAALGFTVSWSQYGTTLGVGGGIPTLPLVLAGQ